MTNEQIAQLADALDAQPREGFEHDAPEGARYITISDTVARQIASALRSSAVISPRAALVARLAGDFLSIQHHEPAVAVSLARAVLAEVERTEQP